MKITVGNSKVLLISFLLGIFILGGVSRAGIFSSNASTPTTFNSVQIFVQTSTGNLSSYTLTVYNSTGYSIATSTSSYPAFGVELPSGTYLFTVMAMRNYGPYASSLGVVNISKMMPLRPVAEYGYSEQQITGPATFNINTTSLDSAPTSNFVLHVYYANGTAASGASVQASIVGGQITTMERTIMS